MAALLRVPRHKVQFLQRGERAHRRDIGDADGGEREFRHRAAFDLEAALRSIELGIQFLEPRQQHRHLLRRRQRRELLGEGRIRSIRGSRAAITARGYNLGSRGCPGFIERDIDDVPKITLGVSSQFHAASFGS